MEDNDDFKFCRYYAAYERNGDRVIYAKTFNHATIFGNRLFDVDLVIDEGCFFHKDDIAEIEKNGWCWG